MEKIARQLGKLLIAIIACVFLMWINIPKSVVQILGMISVMSILFDLD